jgi:hypothetical protein
MLGCGPVQFRWLSIACVLKSVGSVGAEHEVFVESDQRAGVLQGSSSEGESDLPRASCHSGLAVTRP